MLADPAFAVFMQSEIRLALTLTLIVSPKLFTGGEESLRNLSAADGE